MPSLEEIQECLAIQQYCANQGSLPQAILYSTLGVAQSVYYGNLLSGYQGKVEEITEKLSGNGTDSGVLGREVEHFCDNIKPMATKAIEFACNDLIPEATSKETLKTFAQRIGSASQAYYNTLEKTNLKPSDDCYFGIERATRCASGSATAYISQYDQESIRVHSALQARSLSGVTASMRQLNTSSKGLLSCSLGIYDALTADAASGMNSGFAMLGAGLGEYAVYSQGN